jgi:hypothetical protein
MLITDQVATAPCTDLVQEWFGLLRQSDSSVVRDCVAEGCVLRIRICVRRFLRRGRMRDLTTNE